MVDETAPATPPPEPEVKLELEADVVVECPATPRLEASRPTVRQGLALNGWSLERKSAFFKLATEHRHTLGFDDEHVKTVAVDAGARVRRVRQNYLPRLPSRVKPFQNLRL